MTPNDHNTRRSLEEVLTAAESLLSALSGPSAAWSPSGLPPLDRLDGIGALVRIAGSARVANLRAAVRRARGGE